MKNKFLFLLCLGSFNFITTDFSFITTENRTPDQEQALQELLRQCFCTSLIMLPMMNNDKNIERKMETFLSKFKCHELRSQILEEINALEVLSYPTSKKLAELEKARAILSKSDTESKNLMQRAGVSMNEFKEIVKRNAEELQKYLRYSN